MTPVGLRFLPASFRRALLGIAIALGAFVALVPAALAHELDKPCLVIALEKLDGDRIYARKVMLAAPRPGGRHFGLILNQPTPNRMAQLFPDHIASRAVAETVYFGGPMSDVLLALTRAATSPGAGSLELLPGVWLLATEERIDDFMERTPNEARYFYGFVAWPPGALDEEIRKGLVMVRPADPAVLFLPDTSKMYEDLVTPTRKPNVET